MLDTTTHNCGNVLNVQKYEKLQKSPPQPLKGFVLYQKSEKAPTSRGDDATISARATSFIGPLEPLLGLFHESLDLSPTAWSPNPATASYTHPFYP